MSEVKKSYNVELTVERTHRYVVEEANSPEEAEDIAKDWFEDGEAGDILTTDVFATDVYPEEEEDI